MLKFENRTDKPYPTDEENRLMCDVVPRTALGRKAIRFSTTVVYNNTPTTVKHKTWPLVEQGRELEKTNAGIWTKSTEGQESYDK